MRLAQALQDKHRFAGWSLVHDLGCARGGPRRAWNSLCRWGHLARCADLPYADLVRCRRELFDDREFQHHLQRFLGDVHYTFSGLPELYAVVRVFRPRVVVETGVASGMSSSHILRALAVNGRGELYSIDLPNVQQGSTLPRGRRTGWLVPPALRCRWRLQLGDSRKLLPELFPRLGGVDLFLHDSDHSYEGMTFEFEEALPWLKRDALLLSDDIHVNHAWDNFCRRKGLRPSHVENLGITRNRRIS